MRKLMAKLTHYEIETLWVKGALDVAYGFDDGVVVKSGKRAGERGRIIALFALEPAPHYMIEFPDGSSAAALEPEIEPASDEVRSAPRAQLILTRVPRVSPVRSTLLRRFRDRIRDLLKTAWLL